MIWCRCDEAQPRRRALGPRGTCAAARCTRAFSTARRSWRCSDSARIHQSRAITDDVDCWIAVRPEVRDLFNQAVEEIAREKDWPRAWLNDEVATTGGLPEDVTEVDSRPIIECGNVEIRIARPEMLFAMKLYAARPQRDFRDLSELADIVGVATREEAIERFESRYPERELKASAHEWLDQYFGQD